MTFEKAKNVLIDLYGQPVNVSTYTHHTQGVQTTFEWPYRNRFACPNDESMGIRERLFSVHKVSASVWACDGFLTITIAGS